eukprot:363625-Chlamydomonas_euryale.AAC.29
MGWLYASVTFSMPPDCACAPAMPSPKRSVMQRSELLYAVFRSARNSCSCSNTRNSVTRSQSSNSSVTSCTLDSAVRTSRLTARWLMTETAFTRFAYSRRSSSTLMASTSMLSTLYLSIAGSCGTPRSARSDAAMASALCASPIDRCPIGEEVCCGGPEPNAALEAMPTPAAPVDARL